MKVPHPLELAGDHLTNAQTAWTMMRVAVLLEDETSVRQFASEAELAAKHAQACFEMYLTYGDIAADDEAELF